MEWAKSTYREIEREGGDEMEKRGEGVRKEGMRKSYQRDMSRLSWRRIIQSKSTVTYMCENEARILIAWNTEAALHTRFAMMLCEISKRSLKTKLQLIASCLYTQIRRAPL